MALNLSPVDRKRRTYAITVTEDGQPDTVASIDVALVAPRAKVSAATTWVTRPVASGEFSVTYTAPDAVAQVGDVVVPAAGGDVYLKETDADYVMATKVERVTVS